MKYDTGMYVRYKNFANISKIAKITKIEISDNNCYEIYYHFDNEDGTLEGFIIKASHNPINLIEVGDYVNGYKVLEICIGNFEINNPLNVKALKLEFIQEDFNPNIPFFKRYTFITNSEIESIVTKEQFDSMKYKIGEK